MIGDLELYRKPLVGHCYRMLGSAVDAEDAAQESLIRAWRGMSTFDGRASLQTWLYRIATNVCLDELDKRGRRIRPMEGCAPGYRGGELPRREREVWIEPVADARAVADGLDPFEQARMRQSIRLAFVAALQNLAPRQRAALLLVDVLGMSAAEVAETLETTVAAVNSALQRARAVVGDSTVSSAGDLTAGQVAMLEKYVEAFERYDVETLTSLLREDAAFSMPPYSLWLQGPAAVREWLLGIGLGCQGSRLVATAGCGGPAWGQYRVDPDGGWMPWALVVLELDGERIAGWNSFLDTERLFPLFGLPARLF